MNIGPAVAARGPAPLPGPIAGVREILGTLTPRRWMAATIFALIAIGAYLASFAPRSLYLWTWPHIASTFVLGLYAAYVLLVAIGVAEFRAPRGVVPRRRYIVAAVAAITLVVASEVLLAVTLPASRGWEGGFHPDQLVGLAIASFMNWALCGGLAMAVYARLQGVRAARAAIRAAELARSEASRQALASRLAAMQAQVEPRFLLGTLGRIEALYDRDRAIGERMLDGLIAYLRAALPQLRAEGSTLGNETRLAKHFLDVVSLQLEGRVDYRIDMPELLADERMPPMLLLPVVDHALRRGLEPARAGRIDIAARVDGGHLRIVVTDNGLPEHAAETPSPDTDALRERLLALFGGRARFVPRADGPGGTTAILELPRAS